MISVFEDKLLLGKTTADSNGEWVVVLEKRLGPGQHLISWRLEDGSSIMGETSIAIEIYADQSTKPLVALCLKARLTCPFCCNLLMMIQRKKPPKPRRQVQWRTSGRAVWSGKMKPNCQLAGSHVAGTRHGQCQWYIFRRRTGFGRR